MCVLAFAWRAHSRWKLIAAGNRDELHARPAKPLSRLDRPDHLLAGRDLRSGGTWLGISDEGRFAAVTNLRGYGGPQPDRASRGSLVTDFLSAAGRYADPGPERLAEFNPFNLIRADRECAIFLTNRPHPVRTLLAPGLYGVSNGALDEPWPKTLRLKAMVLEWLMSDADHPEILLDALREESLPDVGMHDLPPSDVPQEPALSAIFIRNPVYGTRCSTVVAIDDESRGVIIERRFTPTGEPNGDTAMHFRFGASGPAPDEIP